MREYWETSSSYLMTIPFLLLVESLEGQVFNGHTLEIIVLLALLGICACSVYN